MINREDRSVKNNPWEELTGIKHLAWPPLQIVAVIFFLKSLGGEFILEKCR